MSKKLFTGKFPAVAVPTGGDDGVHVIRFGKASTGAKQCLMYFKITDGEFGGEVVPWFGYLTKDAFERTIQSWRYAGWKGDDILKPGPMDQLVEIEVEINDWDGKQNVRVAFVNPPGGGAMKLKDPVVGKELSELVAKLRGHAKKFAEVDGEHVDRSKIKAAPFENAGDGETRVERDPAPAPAADEWADQAPQRGADPRQQARNDRGGWNDGPANKPAGADWSPDPQDDIPF